jgi:CspA family cold shock protein
MERGDFPVKGGFYLHIAANWANQLAGLHTVPANSGPCIAIGSFFRNSVDLRNHAARLQTDRVRVRCYEKDKDMATGTVKWFNSAKGYGFIEPEDGSKDAFVHISAVEQAGLTTLNEGQKVEYELVPGRDGKSAAENIEVLN